MFDRSHPLYALEFKAPGREIMRRDRNTAAMRKVFNRGRGDAHLMEEWFSEKEGLYRTTLNAEIREWLTGNIEGDMRVLSGLGLTYVTIWSVRDAAMFKLFWL